MVMTGLDVTDVVNFFMLTALGLTLQKPFQNIFVVKIIKSIVYTVYN